LPGGAAELVDFKNDNKPTPYMERIHKIVNYAKDRNDKGSYFPIWGTCLGFEELMVSSAGLKGTTLQDGFDDKAKYHPVILRDVYWKSNFFGTLNEVVPKETQEAVYSKPIAYYYHSEGISVEHMKKFGELNSSVRVLATSRNDKGKEFVAIAESTKYPFWFTQFHPEKHQFEKRRSYSTMDRSPKTIQLMSGYI
jgi:gamma-glutamyl hydrolase